MNNGAEREMEQLSQKAQKVKDKGSIQQLLKSDDTKRMMDLLGSQGSVQDAAKAAAAGRPDQLMNMMQRLVNTEEGAALVERITQQAKKSGL